jgi:general secretion pathway protein D
MDFLKKTMLLVIVLSLSLAPGNLNAARIAGDTREPAEKADPDIAADKKAEEPDSRAKPARAAKKGKRETAAKPAKKPAEAQFVTIDFDNVDIAVFVKFMSEVTGRNFVIDSNVRGKVTIFSPHKISIAEAYKVFESVLEVHGYTTVPAGDVTKIIPAKDAKEKSIETRLAGQAASPADKIITQIVSLNHANPDDIKKVLDPLISKTSIILSYPPTGMLVITDYMSNIKRLQTIIGALDVAGVGEQISVIPIRYASAAEVAKSLTTIFQGDAQTQRRGPISTPMKVIADERTNSVILAANEGFTQRVKQLIAILDRDIPRGESNMNVYRLQNANAEDLAKILMNLPKDAKAATGTAGEKGKAPVLSKDVTVVADKATNSLLITAARDDFKVLSDVIAKLDVQRTMVYIEALIMEVSVTKNFQVGTEWRTMQSLSDSSGYFAGSGGSGTSGNYNILPNFPITASNLADFARFPTGFSMGVIKEGLTLGGITFPSIGVAVQALQQDQDIHILSTPQLMTMDNEEAEINVGKNVPYQTRAETSTANIDYSTYEYKDVGVKLNITPHINDDQFVRLKINQTVSQLASTSSRETFTPTTFKREAKTTVVIKDGETVVIGGIIGDNTQFDDYKVPCLGDIPVLKWAFKSVGQKSDKTNLFIFITPRIVRTHQDAVPITKGKREFIEGVMDEATIKLFDRKERDKDRGKVEKQNEAAGKPAPKNENPAKPAIEQNETVNKPAISQDVVNGPAPTQNETVKPGAKSENPAGAGSMRNEPVIVPAQPNKTAP